MTALQSKPQSPSKATINYSLNKWKKVALSILDLAIITNTITIVSLMGLGFFLCLSYQNIPSIYSLILFTVFIWQVYTVDRLLPHQEDRTEKTNKLHPTNFINQNQRIILFFLITSFLVDLLCILLEKNLIFVLMIGFVFSAAYSFELPLLQKRIKTIPFAKNFYVAFAKIFIAYLISETLPEIIRDPWTFIILYIIVFNSEMILDLKDRDSDAIAEIKTFANVFSSSSIITTAIFLILSAALILYILERDPLHLALVGALVATSGCLVPIYWNNSTRYITSVIELTSALPLIFWSIFS